MKRAPLYLRVSSLDQHPETQRCDLVDMARQRGYEIVAEYEDRISGAKARRPGPATQYAEVLVRSSQTTLNRHCAHRQ